ncbi:MAG TPA: sensor histidine kinase [Terriglobia bacterium]|nr:sensor histidine kinase [Terriglobia bacterium]
MNIRRHNLDEFQTQYLDQLERYLGDRGEDALEEAYELGRQALAQGRGVLEMAAIHQQAVFKIMTRLSAPRANIEAIERAGEFFAQTVAPFEMTHRAFGEANSALSRLNEALEAETRRIAHALHDETGQLLAAIHITLDEVARGLPPPVRERLQEVRKLLDQIETQLRQLSHELRPTVLDDFGLVPAVELLAQGMSTKMKHPIQVKGFSGERLPAPIETALYRIVHEALNNAARHARATRVRVRIQRTERHVLCFVVDNGVGFDPSRPENASRGSGLGLVGIRERLNALGGALEIKSGRGRGTEIRIAVPLEGYDAGTSSAGR